uniref:LOW QUALITY PROTEIN: heat shock factor-binding protein 1-like n=1 Tax=Ictidomys tridecemlineatus TaxID=43179 RepID=UPI001A9EE3A8|nr:LOW QUALITY PROTEIN: heat shock factor-binding protein 1-like [Ictidomys tridecemlineatus]
MAETDLKMVHDFTRVVQTLLQQMQDKFQATYKHIFGRINGTSSHLDDLGKNITDLLTWAGVEELEGENMIPATQKSCRLLITLEHLFSKPREDRMTFLQLTTMCKQVFML